MNLKSHITTAGIWAMSNTRSRGSLAYVGTDSSSQAETKTTSQLPNRENVEKIEMHRSVAGSVEVEIIYNWWLNG